MLDIVASYNCMQFQGKLMIKKTHFWPDLEPLGPNSGPKFFFKNLTLSVTRYHGHLSSCTTSEKTNDPFLRKCSGWRMDKWTDGRTDGQKDQWTDRQTDKSDFIGCCPTNVENLINHFFTKLKEQQRGQQLLWWTVI